MTPDFTSRVFHRLKQEKLLYIFRKFHALNLDTLKFSICCVSEILRNCDGIVTNNARIIQSNIPGSYVKVRFHLYSYGSV